MNDSIFEAVYTGIQKAKAAYDAATDEAGRKAARELYKTAKAPLEDLDSVEKCLWNAYETSRDCGNEYLDIYDTISDTRPRNW